MTLIRDAIQKFNDPNLIKTSERQRELPIGAYNSTRLLHVENVNYSTSQNADEQNPLFVVKVCPKSSKNSTLIQKSLEAQALLREKKVPAEFINYNLYYNSQGMTASEYAPEGDVYVWFYREGIFNNPHWTFETFKRFVAQVVLVTFDLHARGLTHGDIKLENTLVYNRNGKYFFKVADLDTVAEVDAHGVCVKPDLWPVRNHECIGTAPEVNLPGRSHPLNQRAVDCFALGMVINMMALFLLPHEKAQNARVFSTKLEASIFGNSKSVAVREPCTAEPGSMEEVTYQMIAGLTDSNIESRFDIKKIMESPLFGETSIQRMAYFTSVRAEARELNTLVFAKKYLFVPPMNNDAFYLHPDRIKYIVSGSAFIDIELAQLYNSREDFLLKEKRFAHAMKKIEEIFSDITNLSVSHVQIYHQFIGPIILLQKAIVTEKEWMAYNMYSQLSQILTVAMDESLAEFRSTCHRAMNVAPLFSAAYRNALEEASKQKNALFAEVYGAQNYKEAFYIVASRLVIPVNQSPYNSFLMNVGKKLERVLGKSIEACASDLGVRLVENIPTTAIVVNRLA